MTGLIYPSLATGRTAEDNKPKGKALLHKRLTWKD